MGISGLLPLLRSIHKHCTLKKFAGQTIGIDAYGWLHRGTVACAIELALDKPTTKYVDFAISRVQMLLDFGVTPYLVFDGDNLPSKAGTNQERRKRRDESKALGLQLYNAGKLSQAHQELQKSVDVTPYMARLLIEELKKRNVQYIVAPYEADAQLAYLERRGIINGILSEDSDLLVFGAKCLLTKLNQYGECIEINRADFPLCKDISLTGWTDAMFRRMAILSGCDYLTNIEKMGLKTAYRYVRKYKDPEKVLRMIQFEGKFCVPSTYSKQFEQAELTFLHHRVFCPIERKMVFYNDLESWMKEEEMEYLGPYVDSEIAIGVACGDLDPKTKEPITLREPSSARSSMLENRRQTTSLSTELKPRISLDSFFKPNRQPLAELDPNSLTPSPSQQRVLERNRNASWEPRTVASAPQLRRSQTSTSHVSSLKNSVSNHTDRSGFLTRASTLSTYQPPKRQRLCSEAEDISPSQEIKQSPFFANTVAEPSPLALKKSKSKKAKNANFDVWSDDSVDEILLGLPDVQQLASPDKKSPIALCEPSATTVGKKTSPELDSVPQSSPVQSHVSLSPSKPELARSSTADNLPSAEATAPMSTTIISCRDDPEAFERLLDYHVRRQNKTTQQLFVYQSASRRETALKSVSPPSKDPGKQGPTVIAKGLEKQSTDPESSSPVDSLSATSNTLNLKRTFGYLPAAQQANALESLSTPAKGNNRAITRLAKFEALSSEKTETRIVDAKTLPAKDQSSRHTFADLPTTSSTEQDRSSTTLCAGSEDLIVPNTDDESSQPDQLDCKVKLDLKAFAFVAV